MELLDIRKSLAQQANPVGDAETLVWAEESAALGLWDKAVSLVDRLKGTRLAGQALFLKAKVMSLQGAGDEEVDRLLRQAAEAGEPRARLYLWVHSKKRDIAEVASLAGSMPERDLAEYCHSFQLVPEVFGNAPEPSEVQRMLDLAKAEFMAYKAKLAAEAAAKKREEALRAKKLAESKAREKAEAEAREAAESARRRKEEMRERWWSIAWWGAALADVALGGFYIYTVWNPESGVLLTCAWPIVLQVMYSFFILLMMVPAGWIPVKVIQGTNAGAGDFGWAVVCLVLFCIAACMLYDSWLIHFRDGFDAFVQIIMRGLVAIVAVPALGCCCKFIGVAGENIALLGAPVFFIVLSFFLYL